MFPNSSCSTCSTPFPPFDTNHDHQQQQQTLLHPSSFSFLHHHLPPLPLLDEPCFQDQDHQEIDIFLPHHHHHHELLFLHQDQSPCHHRQEGNNYINKSSTTDEDDQIPLLFQGITSTTGNNDKNNSGSSRKMRSCKRDRHSKIKTAKGLRDRRMRLSLEVAKRFFGLQDMLGFDKASKTVEWLLNHSKNEIKKLAKAKRNDHDDDDEIRRLVKSGITNNTISTTPLSSTNSAECEELSCLDDEVAFISSGIQVVKRKSSSSSRGSNNNNKGGSSRNKKRRGSSAVLHHPVIGKESRKKARERARERTKEKEKMKMKMMKISTTQNLLLEASTTITTTTTTTTNHCHQFNDNCNHITQFGSWNPFESTARSQESSGGGKILNNNNAHDDDPALELDVMPEADQQEHQKQQQQQQQQRKGSQPKDDDSFVINMTKWSPSNIFTSFNNSPFSQEHQFAEFQSLAKFWEAHNSHMI